MFLSLADHVVTGGFRLHPHVRDNHLISVLGKPGNGFISGSGRIHFKSIDFENSFQREKDSEFVINQQDATFHRECSRGTDMSGFKRIEDDKVIQSTSDAHCADSGCEANRAPRSAAMITP